MENLISAEKVLVLSIENDGKLTNAVFQDQKNHTLEFYKLAKMDMDEIKDLLNAKRAKTE